MVEVSTVSEHLLGSRTGAVPFIGITSFWPHDCKRQLLFSQLIDKETETPEMFGNLPKITEFVSGNAKMHDEAARVQSLSWAHCLFSRLPRPTQPLSMGVAVLLPPPWCSASNLKVANEAVEQMQVVFLVGVLGGSFIPPILWATGNSYWISDTDN